MKKHFAGAGILVLSLLFTQSAHAQIDDLSVRIKDGKNQLTWSDTGAHHYNVYRSTTAGGPYVLIASTTSAYATYLDAGLTNDSSNYYYVVREAELSGNELSQSNEASGMPTAYTPSIIWNGTVPLAGFGLNIDGAMYGGFSSLPSFVDASAFDFTTGLGDVSATIAGEGSHYVSMFVDMEIMQEINTFFNETGAAVGTPSTGQSWEIDEPGFSAGDILGNFQANSLDNMNALVSPDDVSMALGWDFSLLAGESALIDFTLSDSMPSIFFLSQSDPYQPNGIPTLFNGSNTLYFSSSLEISPQAIPEPSSLLLLGTGLLGVAGIARRRKG